MGLNLPSVMFDSPAKNTGSATHGRPTATIPARRRISWVRAALRLCVSALLATQIAFAAAIIGLFYLSRYDHPAVFAWGQRVLDPQSAIICAALLVGSILTTAIAMQAIKAQRRVLASLLLGSTVVLGCGFFVTEFNQYDPLIHYGLIPGQSFKPNLRYVALQFGVTRKGLRAMIAPKPAAPAVEAALRPGNAEFGKPFFLSTCAACHSTTGAGMPNQGANLRASKFFASRTDNQVLDFVKVGRLPTDPNTVLHLTMPPRGGNPMLDDQKLLDVIAYVRTLQADEIAHPSGGGNTSAIATAGGDIIGHSIIQPPAYSLPQTIQLHQLVVEAPKLKALADFAPPADESLFFGYFFAATGLHTAYLAIGVLLLFGTIIELVRGRDAMPSFYNATTYWYFASSIGVILLVILYWLA